MPLEGKSEPGPRQGPRHLNLPNAMLGAGHPRHARMDPRQEVAMIEMPPSPRRKMIVYRPRSTAFRTSKACSRAMFQSHIEVFLLGGKEKLIDFPGFFQGQQLRHKVNFAHGPSPPWEAILPCFLPTRNSDEPYFFLLIATLSCPPTRRAEEGAGG